MQRYFALVATLTVFTACPSKGTVSVTSGSDTHASLDATGDSPATEVIATDALVFNGTVSMCGDYQEYEASLQAYSAAHEIGLYQLERVDSECSGAGGMYLTLRLREACRSAPEVVRWGAHGCMVERMFRVGELMIVGFDRMPVEAVDVPGWCVSHIPAADGVMRTHRNVLTEAEGKAMLAAQGCPR